MRSGTPSWTGCGLIWRFCSGCCSGGRRSGRVRARRVVRRPAATTPATVGAGGTAGLLAPAPVRDVLGLPRRWVLLPGVRGAVHAAGRSRVRTAVGLAGDRAAGGALPAPVPAGV